MLYSTKSTNFLKDILSSMTKFLRWS